MNITHGHVSIEDGTKAAEEYAPARKVRVELHFAIPENSTDHDKHIQGVATLAQSHVARLLGKASTVALTAAAPKAEEAKPETAAQKKARLAAEKAAGKPAEKTKADLEREFQAELEANNGKSTVAQVAEGELLEDEPEITAAGKVVPKPEDDLSDLLGDQPLVVITDKELGDAVQKKNAERKAADPNWAPAKIRDVISKFSGGKRANDIPAEKRAEFLKEIEALK